MKSKAQWNRAAQVEKEVCARIGGTIVGHLGGVDIVDSSYGKVEVKNDERSNISGNFAFELTNNQGLPSGITTSASDHWFQVSGGKYYVFETATLREKLQGWQDIRRSDEKARNYIVPMSTALGWAKEVLQRAS